MARFTFFLFTFGLAILVPARGDVTYQPGRIRPDRCGLLKTIPAPATPFQSVAFSPNRNLLAVGTERGGIRLLQAGSWRTVRAWKAHSGPVSCLTFSSDGRRLASCSSGEGVRIWNLASGDQIRSLGAAARAAVVRFSPDGTWLAVADRTGRLRIFQGGTGREIRQIDGYAVSPSMLQVSEDGRRLAAFSARGGIILYETSGWSAVREIPNSGQALTALALSPDGKTVFAGTSDGRLYRWNVQSGNRVGDPVRLGNSAVYALACSRDGRLLVAACGKAVVLLGPDATGPVTLSHHTRTVIGVAVSRNRRYVASISTDNQLKIWGNRPGGMRHVKPKGFLGVSVSDAGGTGVVVSQVIPGTAADQNRIMVGDRIKRIDGIEIENTTHAVGIIGSHAEGEEIEIVLERNGDEKTLRIKLGKHPDAE